MRQKLILSWDGVPPTFEEGLSKTIDWYLKNNDWLISVTTGNYKKYYQKQCKNIL